MGCPDKNFINFFKFLMGGLFLLSSISCSEAWFEQSKLLEKSEKSESEDLPRREFKFRRSFSQSTQERKIDLLVVVDNSRSMSPDQIKLGKEFPNLISGVSDSDYRIGVITTDTDSEDFEDTPGYWGNLDVVSQTGKKYISKSDRNPTRLFSDLINRKETTSCTLETPTPDLPPCASFSEKPLSAIKMAIEKRNDQNSGFFRQGADLAVIIITDEDESVDENDLAYSASELLAFVDQEFSGNKKILGFSIAIQDQTCFDEQAKETASGQAVFGVRVGEFARLTGGFNINICNPNFGQDLISISDYLQEELLPFTHKLPETTDLSTISVKVTLLDGRPFDVEIEILNQELRIKPISPLGSTIEIHYDY